MPGAVGVSWRDQAPNGPKAGDPKAGGPAGRRDGPADVIELKPDKPSATADEIHRDLEFAIAKHGEWLQRWHRSMLCTEPAGQDIVSENAHFLCHFGAWFELHKENNLFDQPAFHAVVKVHVEMHGLARTLVEKTWDGGKITAYEHDVLMDCVNEFNDQARRLSKAFGKAHSDIDPLTGAQNRQQLLAELDIELNRYRHSGTPFCVAIADLDHFKEINDGHGHRVGDDVLRSSAIRFISVMRPYDSIYRYGGEEFLICLPNTDLISALAILERLRSELGGEPVEVVDGAALTMTASFGLAEVAGEMSVKRLIDHADKALYRAKGSGRNRVCYWDHEAGCERASGEAPSGRQELPASPLERKAL